ncbi:hypothetical protein G6F56_001065 [Rhizopus delemar]|nr:hypothetical protein G6F56_001065 [Rhizopus delemar]
MSKSNNVVSDLMRAAAGSGARNVADQDIDQYVADLILREAKEKQKKYNEIGIRAYVPSTPKPKPNTRFLLNVVKATDSHNQAVIRSNEENVARLRRERSRREDKRDEDKKTSRKRKHKERSKSPERKLKDVKYRGRGKVRIGSSMDKYFSNQYNPSLDIQSDEEEYKTANEHKKTHKKKKKDRE